MRYGFLLGMYYPYLDQAPLECLQMSSLTIEQILLRRENEEIIKTIMIVKPVGKRKKGRPRMSWMASVEKDLRNVGVVNWRTNAQEVDGWRKFLEQAKTHKVL
jgi:hypothetical protein